MLKPTSSRAGAREGIIAILIGQVRQELDASKTEVAIEISTALAGRPGT